MPTTKTQDTPRAVPLGVPNDWSIDIARVSELEPIHDCAAAVDQALAQPIASLPLAELISPHTQVCIAVDVLSPVTRPMLDALVTAVQACGVSQENITVLTPPGDSSITLNGLRHFVHDPSDIREVDDLGVYEGVPLQINRHAVEASVLLGISVLRLDDSATLFGSLQTIAIGMASAFTQRELNAARFLDDQLSAVSTGQTETLFSRVLRETARRAGLAFCVDVLVDETETPLVIRAGAPQQTIAALTLIANDLRAASVSTSYDLLIAEPGDTDLFHASAAAIQIGLTPDSALSRGGIMVLPVAPDDALPTGDAADFYGALANGDSSEEVIKLLRDKTLSRGQGRAYLLAHVLQRHPVITIGLDQQPGRPKHMTHVRDMAEAADFAEILLGQRPRALLLPNARRSVPVANRFQQSDDDVVDALLRDLDL